MALKKYDVPGPNAKKWVELDKKFISQSFARPYPAVIEKGSGIYVWDVDGNQYMDFNSGIGVCATGHCHPYVVRRAEEQLETLIHMSGTDFYYPAQVKLAQKLAEIVPGGKNKRSFLCNSGAESIEAAMKLSRWSTRRGYFIAFHGAFHGRTYGAMSLTCSKSVQKKHFEPLVPGVIHIPYAYCYRCELNLTYPDCEFACVKYLEDVIFKKVIPPEDVAALFAEPIQGEGGYIIPPDGYYEEIKKILEKYDILFVADEVQSGMGRTGKMFAIEHWDVIPDIVCIAKGIASGLPLGACVARAGLMDWVPGTHASTFGGNPVSCEAALATIELLENGLVENAAKMGEYLLNHLKKLQEKYEPIGDVAGKGLMLRMELVKSRDTKEPYPELVEKVLFGAFARGLLLLPCGESTIRFAPPLIVEKEHIDRAIEIVDDALNESLSG